MIGRLLDGRYKILQMLGAGGFSQTYLALDTRRPSSPTCVVKHLKPNSDNPGSLQIARRLFRSEAETLERIGYHDQIPRLLAYFEEEQEFYLVQEFVEGHLLTTELQPDAPMAEAEVIALLCDVLSTLAFVHSQGVIHRDVKPDNLIRRTEDGKIVLVDFGAVKTVWSRPAALQGQRGGTVAGTIIGTPGYMSTEQGRGKPRPSSDIYALGMIGVQAFTGLNPVELQEDSQTGEPLWQEHARVSPELGAIVSKMVSYHFKDRYQSAVEALEALQPLVGTDRYFVTPSYLALPSQPQTVDRTPAAPQSGAFTEPPAAPTHEETRYAQPIAPPEYIPEQPAPAVAAPSTREETYYGQSLPFIPQPPATPTREGQLPAEPNRDQTRITPPGAATPATRETTDDGQSRFAIEGERQAQQATSGATGAPTRSPQPGSLEGGSSGNKTLILAGASIAAVAAAAAIGFFVFGPSATQPSVPATSPPSETVLAPPVQQKAPEALPPETAPQEAVVTPPRVQQAVVPQVKPAIEPKVVPQVKPTSKQAVATPPAPRPIIKAAVVKPRPVAVQPRPKPQKPVTPTKPIVARVTAPKPTQAKPKPTVAVVKPQPAKAPATGGLRPATAPVTGTEAVPEGLRPASSPLGTPR